MDYEKIINEIKKQVLKFYDHIEPYSDMFYMIIEQMAVDKKKAKANLLWLDEKLKEIIRKTDNNNIYSFFNLHKQVIFYGGRYLFQLYLIALEWKRPDEQKFYLPREKRLRPLVDLLQELADDKLDVLGISLPPGVGKTTLALFYITFLAGAKPWDSVLTASHSNDLVQGLYKEALNVMTSDEYCWSEIFRDVPIVDKNAKTLRIDLESKKRFDTLQFTSIGAGNAGKLRAMQLLYCDDLVSGIEVALSKDRLDKLWATYTTDLRQRKQGSKCKELHIATRWSVHDVIGRLEVIYEGDDRAKFIRVPALDENGESNFDYAFEKGFSTQAYIEQRDVMDELDWKALYMNEPIERDGLLYDSEELRRYFDLPQEEPDTIIAVCDTKDTGKDYAVLPIAYVYGNDYYIEDVLVDNGNPDVIEEKILALLMVHKVKTVRFESNSAGRRFANDVARKLKELGSNTHVTTKYNRENKETRIMINSTWVKQHCIFKDDTQYKANSDYARMIRMLTGYTSMGRNKYDDVPDAMSMLSDFAQSFTNKKVEILNRIW